MSQTVKKGKENAQKQKKEFLKSQNQDGQLDTDLF